MGAILINDYIHNYKVNGITKAHLIIAHIAYNSGKNAYGSKTRTKVVMEAESCTLKLSGERVYILLPDGSEIIKARHNVRWQQG